MPVKFTLLHNPRCTGSKRGRDALLKHVEAHGSSLVTVEVQDYLKHPPTRDQFELIVSYFGDEAYTMIRGCKKGEKTGEQMVDMLVKSTKWMKRPIGIDWEGKRAVYGRPPEKLVALYQDMVEREHGKQDEAVE